MKRKLKAIFRRFERLIYENPGPAYRADLSISEAKMRFREPNELYRYMHFYYKRYLDNSIREHRSSFAEGYRGFGEDAFHSFWYLLLREYRPEKVLEIGVYRGQSISLWSLIGGLLGLDIEVHGLSPFSSSGDSVSDYLGSLDYKSDVLENFANFNLKRPVLYECYSTDGIAKRHVESVDWDMVYIDGNHDYDVVKSDYELALPALKKGGLLILDDASLDTEFVAREFSFAGHPGPSKLARERAEKELIPVCAVGHNRCYQKP